MNRTILSTFLFFLCISCSFYDKQGKENIKDYSLIEFDLTYKYPEKVINLNDIADIKYIPLETTDESLIGVINKYYYTDSLIILVDSQQKIFFFNTNGRFLHSFYHLGSSPYEYQLLKNFTVDPCKKELYINDAYAYRFIVYDYEGNYIREFKYNKEKLFNYIYNYNQEYILAYNVGIGGQNGRFLSEEYPYLLISKKDGTIKTMDIQIQNGFSNNIVIYNPKNGSFHGQGLPISHLTNSNDRIIISDYAKDTIYSVGNSEITPIAVRKNIHVNPHEYHLSAVGFNCNRYLSLDYIRIATSSENERDFNIKGSNSLLCDKHTGEIFSYKFANPDFGDIYSDWNKWFYETNENVVICEYPMDLLMKNKKLKGELKKIRESRSFEDNPVLVVAKFKE